MIRCYLIWHSGPLIIEDKRPLQEVTLNSMRAIIKAPWPPQPLPVRLAYKRFTILDPVELFDRLITAF